eukprot:g3465.t1
MLLIKRTRKKAKKKKRKRTTDDTDDDGDQRIDGVGRVRRTLDESDRSISGKRKSEDDAKSRRVLRIVPTEEEGDAAPPVTTAEELSELKRACATATFSNFRLSEWIVRSCAGLRMTRPTPVQLKCIPPILKGRNCVACAQTGSGKTATFALPILEHLSKDPYGVFALVLTPTRELAMQIADQFNAIGAPMKVRVAIVIGGLSSLNQSLELQKRPHIVVATPGRFAAHIESASPPYLKRLKYLVLDEADRLLEGSGFEDDLRTIVAACPSNKRRQTLLFSATMDNSSVRRTALGGSASVPDPYVFDISDAQSRVAVPETLKQMYIFVPSNVKVVYLFYTLLRSLREEEEEEEEEDTEDGTVIESVPRIRSAIVFCATCQMCQLLTETALEMEIPAVCLHSQMTQNRRIAALTKFKSGGVRLLFATDVASRGLDIPSVEMVVNFDIPKSAKDYVHRVGRAARAGRSGSALTVVSQHDIELLQSIEAYTGKKLVDFSAVSDAESKVLKLLQRVSTATRLARMRIAQEGWGGGSRRAS